MSMIEIKLYPKFVSVVYCKDCRGTARWASEIEEFPIAVTQYWFEEGNEKWY